MLIKHDVTYVARTQPKVPPANLIKSMKYFSPFRYIVNHVHEDAYIRPRITRVHCLDNCVGIGDRCGFRCSHHKQLISRRCEPQYIGADPSAGIDQNQVRLRFELLNLADQASTLLLI